MKQDPFSNLENDVTVPDLETGSAEVTFEACEAEAGVDAEVLRQAAAPDVAGRHSS